MHVMIIVGLDLVLHRYTSIGLYTLSIQLSAFGEFRWTPSPPSERGRNVRQDCLEHMYIVIDAQLVWHR